MKYRNTKTGVVVDIQSEAKGDWELIPETPLTAETVQAEEEKPTPKRTRKKK